MELTRDDLMRVIPKMLAAFETPDLRLQMKEAAEAGRPGAVMLLALHAQTAILKEHGLEAPGGLRAVATAARRWREDPEIKALSQQLEARLVALARAAS